MASQPFLPLEATIGRDSLSRAILLYRHCPNNQTCRKAKRRGSPAIWGFRGPVSSGQPEDSNEFYGTRLPHIGLGLRYSGNIEAGAKAFASFPGADAVERVSVYLDYFGLTEPPFDLTPNPRFLFFSGKHREALNHLLYGIRERKGFVQITGEVGAGKTTLCRAMLDQLDDGFATALILNPVLDAEQLMRAIAMEFGLKVEGLDRLQTMAAMNDFLLKQVEHHKTAVLIIDEAQDLTNELLEQVRLLSNLETDECKLLQIVLLGQPELRDRLNHPRLRQLRQRITVRYHLWPLTLTEVGQYVQHRLAVSGAKGAPYFTLPALWRIYHYSRGIPRLVNAVCDKCLLAAYVQQRDWIDYQTVGRAVRELEGQIDV
jgi:general secretion pathway protein A